MSQTQARLGACGVNWRLSTLAATGKLWRESVVCVNLRRQRARKPLRRMSPLALCRPTARPCALSAALRRLLP